MFRTTALLIIFLAGLSVWAADTAAPAEEQQLQEDRAAIEGIWRRSFRDKSGRELTTTKTERAGRSTVTVRDADGNILHEHHSDYELQRSGEVRIFKYSNRTVTHGPDAGLVDPRPRRYIYRISGDRFYEIHGVLTDDERQPTIFVWERVVTKDEVTALSKQLHRSVSFRPEGALTNQPRATPWEIGRHPSPSPERAKPSGWAVVPPLQG